MTEPAPCLIGSKSSEETKQPWLSGPPTFRLPLLVHELPASFVRQLPDVASQPYG
jgi:hypothetical protein